MTAKDPSERVRLLCSEASRMTDGPQKVEILEEAVRIADLHQDLELSYDARQALIEGAMFSGFPDRMLVAYAWCLAQFDRDPERFDAHHIHWCYKWVLSVLDLFPGVSRAKIEATFEDAFRRFRERGYSPRPVHEYRALTAAAMGDDALAREHYKKWNDAPRDYLADCAACDAGNRIEFLVDQDRDEEAVQTARPLVLRRLSCHEQPHRAFCYLPLPLLRLGQAAEGIPLYLHAVRKAGTNPNMLNAVSRLLDFAVLTENLTRAVRLAEKHVRNAFESPVPRFRWEFLLSLRLLFARLAETRPKGLKFRLPKGHPLARPDALPPAELLAWCDGELDGLARAFDARNGNDAFTRRRAAHRELARHASPFPISKA
jgi:hypothetical protein